MSNATHRIVHRYDVDGRSFKVQKNDPPDSNRWRTVDGFTNLKAAKKRYPNAVTEDRCYSKQLDLERPHPFSRDNEGSNICHACGNPHEAGGAS